MTMEPTYDPASIEARWYAQWEAAGIFRPEYRTDGEPFSIVIPPPNVTGQLHMGHALDHSIQDVIIRRKRMQGFAALWVPGTDHAGIATQNVVERELAAEGLDRHELGREAFIEQVWAWKQRYGDRITEQIRTMGLSVDWSRERFTMDEGLSEAVRHVFVRLYNENLIYRGNRIINWCPRCETALAEIEVEYQDDLGEMVHIFYPFTDGEGGVTVATTRAETMLGDTGVAVHPEDERHADAIGKTVRLPLMDRDIPIVADAHVDPEFGTGAVKVTPAHDPNDFEIGKRHDLDFIKIFDRKAVVTEQGGRFAGMNRFDARSAVKAALDEVGALVKVEEHGHSVGHCYRCGTAVEPYLSLQWFVKVRPITEPAINVVRGGSTRFVPQRWENSYFHWMENLRDWCISRQIWWGHRIPAWHCDDCDEILVSETDPTACAACGSEKLQQDEDVLDTWFSSALWPFSTLGWPNETEDLAKFYPNAVLVTGYDIIYFWVARMMQMGIHFLGEVPFADIMIHGLVRTADGAKMSKSSGNTIDPLEVGREYGIDPLRLALLQAASPGQDVPLDMEWVQGTRKFGNKLWNGVRFGLSNLEASVPADGGYPEDPAPVNAWVLSRLAAVAARFDELADEYRFSDAFGLLYSFTWSEVFDWYLEMAKPMLTSELAYETKATLGVVLRDVIKLFHPAIPFLTEELWSHLVGEGFVAGADWPQVPVVMAPKGVDSLQDLVSAVRSFRASHGLSPKHELELALLDPDGLVAEWWHPQLAALANVTARPVSTEPGTGYTRLVAGSVQAFIPLASLIDIDAERARIDKALTSAQKDLQRAKEKLSNPKFRNNAPDDVIAKEQSKADEMAELISKLQRQAEELA